MKERIKPGQESSRLCRHKLSLSLLCRLAVGSPSGTNRLPNKQVGRYQQQSPKDNPAKMDQPGSESQGGLA